MQKSIKAKAKDSLLPPSMLYEMDQRIAHSKKPAEIIRSSTQEASMKNPKTKELKPQAKPAPA